MTAGNLRKPIGAGGGFDVWWLLEKLKDDADTV
jgi:hypothetical protein